MGLVALFSLVKRSRWATRILSPAAVALACGMVVVGGAAGWAPAAASASAGPASTGAPRATGWIWHTLPLENGWKSASKTSLITGTPAWALSRGVIYLRGAIFQPGAADDTVAQLPRTAWPASNLYLNVYTNGDVPGVLFIGKTGVVQAFGGNSAAFTSLAAVSYPATTMKSHKLALKNGWVSSQSVWATGDPAYEVSGGIVYLSGSLQGGKQHLAAVLPTAARPSKTLYVQAYTYAGTTGWVEVLPNGNVAPFGSSSADYTSLAGISFPVASTKWKAFSLEDQWTSGAAKFRTAAPSYAIVNGVVYLNGTMYQAKPGNGLWTSLPAGVKTAADVLEIEADASGGSAGVVSVTSSLGLAGSVPFTNAQKFLSLSGIAYAQGS
jgi:hypothetical protein